ncbi:hypothetical protein SCLCIDRAFT_1104083 [Scleroderma citrinum Foug A]|uniref:Uncharacterized protein n=1 Tax=Scleroderma citrinum Foug A TaxID=1036808 RepID=A0A0C3DP95_9AGAM|nr:hypothetical protein SCLCIDRAFT_1104083 [Scleroderma citrinum Foug A]
MQWIYTRYQTFPKSQMDIDRWLCYQSLQQNTIRISFMYLYLTSGEEKNDGRGDMRREALQMIRYVGVALLSSTAIDICNGRGGGSTNLGVSEIHRGVKTKVSEQMGGKVHQRRVSEISSGDDDGSGEKVALPARFSGWLAFVFFWGSANE